MNKNLVITFLAVLTVIGFGWGFYETRQTNAAAVHIENDATRAYYELTDAADRLSVLTAKTLAVSDSGQCAALCSDISRTAYVAQENLSMLPIYHSTLSRTERFLNQLSDFSASLVTKTAEGEGLSSEDRATLRTLNEELTKAAQALHKLEEGDDAPFSYKAILAAEKSLATNDLDNAGAAVTSLGDINRSVEKTPSLIYDGPYSDHLENKGPINIEGEPIHWFEAKSIAKKLLGDDYQYEAYGKSSEDAAMAVYTVAVKTGKNGDPFGYLDISIHGGHVVQYTAEPQGEAATLSGEEALAKATAFLEKAGYQNMQPGYYLTKNNVLTANFMYRQNGVILYPDMIKVSVDLTDGTIVGLDAKNYIENHKERSLPALILTEAAAASHLPGGYTLLHMAKAVIPKNDGSEAYCYELHFSDDATEYLLYINAETGKEEDIFIVKDDETGTFTL